MDIVAEGIREKQPRPGALMDASGDDVPAYMAFPRELRAQIASTNPPERVNRKGKRRADVIGVRALLRTSASRPSPPDQDAIVRLVGALRLETTDEWTAARR